MKQIFAVGFLISLFFTQSLSAQRTKPKPVAQKIIKPIKFTASIGGYKNGDQITKLVAENIIGQPLNIFDDKKNAYQISSYEFLYREIVNSEDENSGKPYKTTSVKSSLFKTTPLPNNWLNMLKENLKPGEELMFFAIIVKDGKGNVMYAPDLKITIK
jgi:hypothetical protein